MDPIQRAKLVGNLLGIGIKFSAALFYQEGSRLDLPGIDSNWIYSPELNVAGAKLIPFANKLANVLNKFAYHNKDFAVVIRACAIVSV